MKTHGKKGVGSQSVEGGPLPSLEARVRLHHNLNGKRELLGFADLTIGGAFVIKDINVLRVKSDGKDDFGSPFVSFPNKKGTGANESKYFDVAFPITTEAHKAASEAVLKAFAAAQQEAGAAA